MALPPFDVKLTFVVSSFVHRILYTAGWTTFSEGTGCMYKHVADKESWFHATSHCQDTEEGSDLARVLSAPEAQFVANLSEEPQWVFNFFEEGKWNIDYEAHNLWASNQPGNVAATLKFCVAQSGNTGNFVAEQCNQKLGFVCKRCPSEEASNKIVPSSAIESPSEPDQVSDSSTHVVIIDEIIAVVERQTVRERRQSVGGSQLSTTTTTEEPDIGSPGGVAGIAAGPISILETVSTGTASASSSTATLVVAVVVVSVLLVGATFGARKMMMGRTAAPPTVASKNSGSVLEMSWDDEMTPESKQRNGVCIIV
jgi:cobalamin biosynthesis Mg chelatase CobN